MPAASFPISGTVKDLMGNPISNLTITGINQTQNSESLTTTTNSLGEYGFNAADFNTEYVNADIISVRTPQTGTWEGSSASITIDTTDDGATANFTLLGNHGPLRDGPKAIDMKTFEEGMAQSRRDFWFGCDDLDAVDLTAAYTTLNGISTLPNLAVTTRYLTLNPGEVAYITQTFVSVDGTTDRAMIKIAKNSASDGTGTSIALTREMVGSSNGSRDYKLAPVLRVAYDANYAKSIVIIYRGTGTTDDLISGCRGYIVRE